MTEMTEINTEMTEMTPFEERLNGSYALVMPEGLTFYWQPIPSTEATSEVIQEHLQNGWQPMTAKDARIIVLQSMFASVHGLAENDESISLWSLTENIEIATQVPVALASQIDRTAIEAMTQETNHDIPIYVRTVNPLPLPTWGTVGIVWHDEQNITTIRLEALPPEAQTLQQNISELIKETVEDADWWLSDNPEPTPDMIAALRAMNERIRADLAGYDERTKALAKGGRVLARMYHDYYVTKILPQRTPTKAVVKRDKVLDDIANVFLVHNRRAVIPMHQAAYAILGFQHNASTVKSAKDMGRLTMIKDTNIPNYRHVTLRNTTDVQYRETDKDATTESVLLTISKIATSIDSDVFLCFLAQFMIGDKDPSGGVWITAQSIMAYRGLKQIRGSHGYRQEQYQEVENAVNRLEKLWITVAQDEYEEPEIRKNKKTRKRRKLEDRVILIRRRYSEHEIVDGAIPETSCTAWCFELGGWHNMYVTGANRQMGYIIQKLLEYDPHNEAWEKRIGLYAVFHLRMNHNRMTRTIGLIIEDRGLSAFVDYRSPEKTKKRFEKAMNTLQADGNILSWEYQDTTELPARHWLQTWLERKVEIYGNLT